MVSEQQHQQQVLNKYLNKRADEQTKQIEEKYFRLGLFIHPNVYDWVQ